MHALLIIDVQNDFCPGGNLPVSDGDKIIPVINQLSPFFDCVVQTQDWHPLNHTSFASNHPGKSPYDTIGLPYGEQVLWPNHCVKGSRGADFHPELDTLHASLIIRKGYNPNIDSYSAFYENDQTTITGLNGFLKEMNVDTVFIAGLATDFCVKWSALDAIKNGYITYIVSDAVKGIDIDNSVELSVKEMCDNGVEFIESHDLLRLLKK